MISSEVCSQGQTDWRRSAHRRTSDGNHSILDRLASHLQPVACARGPRIEAQDAVVRLRHLARYGYLTAADHADVGNGVVGGATRPGGDARGARPVRPATRWMRVVSRASARVMSGRMVARGRASIDVPAPGDSRRRRFGSQRLHHLSHGRCCHTSA
jgi:hypothetical protein